MSYEFIDLDNSKVNEIKEHLENHCGIDSEAGLKKQDLIDLVISFEENNGLAREFSKLPVHLKAAVEPESESDLPKHDEPYKPVVKHERVRVKLMHSEVTKGMTDLYVSVNEYNAQIPFDQEVDIPEPIFQMLNQAVKQVGKQLKNGDIQFTTVANYNVQYIGKA